MSTPPTNAAHILVTGGAGFIGSHLVERLLADGERVAVIDDGSTGAWANLAAVRGHPALECIEARVSACAELDRLVAQSRFVFHLAAAVGVELVIHSPIRTIETNLRETEAVLEAASRHRVPLLLTSTSEVYGKSQRAEFSEDDDLLIGPPHLGRWSYACSKLMDEFLALAHHRERGLPVIIARLFNTVGPRQTGRYGMVLPRFIEAARAGRPLRVHGDGSQTRCFCHVLDTVEALTRLMRCPDALGQVVNVGSTEETTIRALAEMIVDATGSESTIEVVPYDSAYEPGFEDMLRRRPSVAKLERLTGFKPARRLAEIIRAA
ncbi:MAG: NAD-dependent epimerase/dehydratase family protein [Verrucomicrobia bacterium]|nr:NAD-dependent epimerase/dehydratase family protein [Verrucomicrobiota bacterium]